MKPNLILLAVLILITSLLFLNLPEDAPYANLQSGPQAPQDRDAGTKDATAELQRMRSDYAKLLEEMAMMRARLEKNEVVAPVEQRRAAMPRETREDESAPGITIYLDTSKLPATPNQAQEWTAVGFHDAGRAPDGSKQAVLSITKLTRPGGGQGSQPAETVRTLPVSHWQ